MAKIAAVKALEALREADPAARELWNVQGPRDGDSRISAILARVGGERREIIAQTFADGSYTLYAEVTVGTDEAAADAVGAHYDR